MKKLKNIKKKPLIFLVLIVLLVSIGGTIAYFNSELNIANKFKTATFKVEIEENFDGVWKPDGEEWTTKEVTFVNKEETNAPVVLRINYNELWSKDINEKLLTLSNIVNGNNVVEKKWTDEFKNNFVYGEDGWYYYKKVLNAQESVKVLEKIKLNETAINESKDAEQYKDFNYELTFNFEAIQADKKAVNEIWEYNIEINNNIITWPFE